MVFVFLYEQSKLSDDALRLRVMILLVYSNDITLTVCDFVSPVFQFIIIISNMISMSILWTFMSYCPYPHIEYFISYCPYPHIEYFISYCPYPYIGYFTSYRPYPFSGYAFILHCPCPYSGQSLLYCPYPYPYDCLHEFAQIEQIHIVFASHYIKKILFIVAGVLTARIRS